LQTLLTFSGWIRVTRCSQLTIQFLLYQSGVFRQADHLSPDDLIKEFLSDEAAMSQTGPPSFRQLSEPMHL